MLEKYRLWSSYTPEERGVLIAYGSMYGNTEQAVHKLAARLSGLGVKPIRLFDVSKTHVSHIVAQAFRLSHWVFASPTYNLGLYAPMEALLRDLAALNVQNRDVALIANGSWAPAAGEVMADLVSGMKDMRLHPDILDINSALTPAKGNQLNALADSIKSSLTTPSTKAPKAYRQEDFHQTDDHHHSS